MVIAIIIIISIIIMINIILPTVTTRKNIVHPDAWKSHRDSLIAK